jgi:hypothetical protein
MHRANFAVSNALRPRAQEIIRRSDLVVSYSRVGPCSRHFAGAQRPRLSLSNRSRMSTNRESKIES